MQHMVGEAWGWGLPLIAQGREGLCSVGACSSCGREAMTCQRDTGQVKMHGGVQVTL